jgi:hypothetical protein
MGWSRVFKTINGHRYVYEQRTWREDGRVRTGGFYVGRELRGPSAIFHGSRSTLQGRPRSSENATYGPGFYLASQTAAELYAMHDPDQISSERLPPAKYNGAVYCFDTSDLRFLLIKNRLKYKLIASMLAGNDGDDLPEAAKIEAQLRWARQGYDGLTVLDSVKPATVVFPTSLHRVRPPVSSYSLRH